MEAKERMKVSSSVSLVCWSEVRVGSGLGVHPGAGVVRMEEVLGGSGCEEEEEEGEEESTVEMDWEEGVRDSLPRKRDIASRCRTGT